MSLCMSIHACVTYTKTWTQDRKFYPFLNTRLFSKHKLSKIGNAAKDLTLNTQLLYYPAHIEYLPPRGPNLVRFILRLVIFETQGHRKLEMQWMIWYWPLTLNCLRNTWYTACLPRGPFFRFTLRPAIFYIQVCWKSAMHRMPSGWTWTRPCQKYPKCTEYLPPGAQISSVLLNDHPFSRNKVAGNSKCTEWPQADREHLTPKRTLYTVNACHRDPNFTPFISAAALFRDNGSFWFPCMLQEKILKNRKFNFQKSTLYFCEDRWEENSREVWKIPQVIWGKNSFLNGSILVKTEKHREKLETQNHKNAKQYFCEDHWKENSRKVWQNSEGIRGRFIVLKYPPNLKPKMKKIVGPWTIVVCPLLKKEEEEEK